MTDDAPEIKYVEPVKLEDEVMLDILEREFLRVGLGTTPEELEGIGELEDKPAY